MPSGTRIPGMVGTPCKLTTFRDCQSLCQSWAGCSFFSYETEQNEETTQVITLNLTALITKAKPDPNPHPRHTRNLTLTLNLHSKPSP